MADLQSSLFSAVSEHRTVPKLCASCGKIIPSHKHKYCNDKCKYDRIRAERTHTHCSHCGNEIGPERSVKARYCSDKCKGAAQRAAESESGKRKAFRAQAIEKHNVLVKSGAVKTCRDCGTEKPLSEYYPGLSSCKECLRLKSKERMRVYLADGKNKEKSYRARKEWKKNNKEKVKVQAINYRVKIGDTKYQQHVREWRKWLKAERSKLLFDAHVKCFKEWKKTPASRGWFARKLKAEGRPWANPHFSAALRYKIKYRTSLEFRLSEINRNTWRKEILFARNDGTVNFWELMRERKTCPYCLTPITKENAVTDHMDPIKLGGANSQHNLTICCRSCNQRKSGRPYMEWVDMLPADRRSPALAWYNRKHGHGPEQSTLEFVFAG